MLSWWERKAAATLFATPPTATLEETLTHLLKVCIDLLSLPKNNTKGSGNY